MIDRVTRREPCLVCGKADWCYRSPSTTTSDVLHCCMRVAEAPAGMKMITSNRVGAHVFAPTSTDMSDRPLRLVRPPSPPKPCVDWSAAQRQFETACTPSLCDELEEQLGIPIGFALALGLGWCEWQHAWSWPMRDPTGTITGIQLRLRSGGKRAIRGSQMGLYHVGGLRPDSTIYVCEGPTDTASMLSLGLEAIGRASCRGSHDMIARMVRGRDVVIVSDADGPGRQGADALARDLVRSCREVKVIEPVGAADARDWVTATASRELVESVARNAVAV